MRATLILVLAGLGAVAAPGVGVCDPLPAPPPNELHIVVAPGSPITTAAGPVITAKADELNSSFGGIYTPPALARWDLERLKRLEAERDAALKVAYDRPPPGLKPLAVGLGIGVAVGGTAAAWSVDGKPGVKAIASIGSAALGSLILWLASR
jgi:hypothetical protein